MGGYPLGTAFDDLLLDLARGPRILFVPTPAHMPDTVLTWFYGAFARRAEPAHVLFNPWPPDDLRELVLGADVIFVSGGNTANALAVWRVHGFDELVREAWEGGALLCGLSAGMICWFEASVTDSFGPQLAGMRDGLGFLAGSACPHYDGEEPAAAGLHGARARRVSAGDRVRRRRGGALRGDDARRRRLRGRRARAPTA